MVGFLPWIRRLACLGAILAPQAAMAHEPLWGETPSVFGFGVVHPEVRVHFLDAGSARRRGVRHRMLKFETMVQYAPSTSLNVQLEAPWVTSVRETGRGRNGRRVSIGGLGDLELTAKRRFWSRQEIDLNVQQALIYGIKLPTGRSDHRDLNGKRADPREQPGTGRLGLTVGYAWDRETVRDTTWASTRLHQDVGGGFRAGLRGELDAAYGYWFVRPNEAREIGFNLAFGIHAEFHASDRLGGGRSAGNSHRLLGLHLTPIVTRGNYQLRVGALVPLVRSGAPEHVHFPIEFGFGLETFF